ncbi:oligopeptide transport ATP-binding protein AppD [Pseudovibrio sp. FO-BEG1]|uniref:ABC transporter ATP-binding protein n=1 Tax=Pseudovibrio TaxID=258255 RepID=UPI000186B8F4|nr:MULTISPECIES: ABC transporter ATP-binding protein [unclassified Pseudovibrio]AEV37379.1 oligopeptide transport ATP-binding protein AppD [Pseudovibrio sp. FO-BEG1]EEA96686.1 oligopeptide ABC transporter, ATP-binding protein [Pseudovibrio sp. JE062]
MQDETILEINDLNICFEMREGTVNAVNGVTFSVKPGEVLGIVGESGSGKSLSARSIMNLLPRNATVTNGSVKFRKNDGEVVDILAEKRESRKMRELRGGHIGMIFQEPMTALSPVHSIGKQIMTTLNLHTDLSKKAQVERAAELLAMVQMPKPMEMLKKYPHQLSGGMRQRAMIAMALSCNPSLLLADEPTTALDVTTEAQILDLIMSLQDELNMAVIFITHNFGVVAEIADRVSVMYLGNAVETASVDDIFYHPKHPYTRALLQSIPRLDGQKRRRLQTIEGMVPDPFNLPTGCVFHTRCAEKMAGKCTSQIPELTHFENDQMARCHLHQA